MQIVYYKIIAFTAQALLNWDAFTSTINTEDVNAYNNFP